MNKRKRRIVKGVLLAGCLAVIFLFSSQNGAASQELSDAVLTEIYPSWLSADMVLIIEKYGPLIRKLAHLTEFFFLGIFIYINVIEYAEKFPVLISQLLSSIYAVSDELHQLFVEGRSAALKDVLIDSCGAFFGIFIVHQIIVLWRKDRS